MKKPIKKYVVTKEMDAEEIKGIGFSRYFHKMLRRFWYIYIIAILIFIVPVVYYDFIDQQLPHSLAWLSLVVGFGTFFVTFCFVYNAGKKFFNKVKDMPEPIDLRKVK